jgi:DNA (cytosine-5)-methyltransferase 1
VSHIKPTAYYNENDPGAAAWLRELVRDGQIAPGDVDERDIRDVVPGELVGYRQCHFFAGVGGWSLALRLAGWPADRPVWTGSCPCQPFSAAGRGAGFADERHLWPAWFHLIGQCRPLHVFGEQVAAKDGLGWLDLVWSDLEAAGYAVGAFDLSAAGVGAFHIRQRLWFVAESSGVRRPMGAEESRHQTRGNAGPRLRRHLGVVEHPAGDGRQQGRAEPDGRLAAERRGDGLVGDPGGSRLEGWQGLRRDDGEERPTAERAGRATGPRPLGGAWANAAWLPCQDGRWRPIESVAVEVADGLPDGLGLVRLASHPDRPHAERLIHAPLIKKGKARVMRLRGYGNAIVPQVAAEVVGAYLEHEADREPTR